MVFEEDVEEIGAKDLGAVFLEDIEDMSEDSGYEQSWWASSKSRVNSWHGMMEEVRNENFRKNEEEKNKAEKRSRAKNKRTVHSPRSTKCDRFYLFTYLTVLTLPNGLEHFVRLVDTAYVFGVGQI